MEKYNQTIEGEYNTYNLALVIEGYAYYVDYEENDENSIVLIMNSDHEIICNNVHAAYDFLETLEKIHNGEQEYIYMSDKLKGIYEEQSKMGYFEK